MSSRKKLSRRSPDAIPGRAIAAISGTAVAITPLALVTGVFISHDVIPKVMVLTSAAALLMLLFPRWQPELRALSRFSRGRAFLILVLAQFISLLFSTLFSSQIPLSLAGTVWRRFGLIGQSATLIVAVAFACMAASVPARIQTLFRSVTVCGGLAAIYGILQYFSLDPFLDRRLYTIDYFGGVARPPSTMGHALYFSAYLVPVLFIALASTVADSSRIWRRGHVLMAVLAGVAIVLSGTRSAMAAAAIGGIFFAWRSLRGQSQILRSVPLKYVAVALGTLLAASAFVISPAGSNLRSRAVQWQSEGGGPRLQMWKECPGLIARHPLLGEGPETFAGEFREIESLQLSRAFPDFYNETPHNALLDAACAQGIPGAVILAGIFLLAGMAGRSGNLPASPVRTGLNAALAGILISSMFASFTLVSSLYLWTIAGVAVALNPGEPLAEQSLKWQTPRFVPIAAGTAYFILGTMLALQDAAWSDMGVAVGAGNSTEARKAYSRAISVSLGLPGYELWGSQEWALLGRSLVTASAPSPDAAAAWKLAAASAAIAESEGEERFSAAYQSSVLAVAIGDLPKAESEAHRVIRLAPNWYKGHLLLSQILQYLNRTHEASQEANLSEAMGWRKQP